MRRILCTTSLEETWPQEGPVVFLGEWCRRYSRRDRWKQMDAPVVPYHWDDRRRLRNDYRYLMELHERLLPEVAAALNGLHGTRHGTRYWRIMIGPWLGAFLQMLFDRWTSIEQALSSFDIGGSLVFGGDRSSMVPRSSSDFTRLYVGDEWNHHLYAEILRHLGSVPLQEVPPPRVPEKRPFVRAGLARRAKQSALDLYTRSAALLSRAEDAFFLATYLPIAQEMRMHWHFRQMPQLWQFVAVPPHDVDERMRQWRIGTSPRSAFEAFAIQMIPRQLPTVFVEGYQQLLRQVSTLPWPQRPQFIWTSNSHGSDDLFKAWAAERAERGTPLIIGQHGGHYGTGAWCFAEEHDIRISDRYLSWGWSDAREPKVVPVGQLRMRRPLGVQHEKQSRAVLVMGGLPRYSYWMFSATVAGQFLDYFNDQLDFVGHLPAQVRDALTVRLYPEDFGWDQKERWRDRFPTLQLDSGATRMDDLLRQCRLYIATYNATTFLESFTMEIPTVMHWNEQHWELRPSAQPWFDELKRVGILHTSPQSAAAHVARIWDDVGAWWHSPPVRAALERFNKQFNDLSAGCFARVEQALRTSTPHALESAG